MFTNYNCVIVCKLKLITWGLQSVLVMNPVTIGGCLYMLVSYPDECGLAGSSWVFFLHLLGKRTLKDKWHRFYHMTLCQHSTSVCCRHVSVCVCPCVCLSVTSQHCTKMVKCTITQTTPYNSPRNLVSWCQKSLWNFNGVTLYMGAK